MKIVMVGLGAAIHGVVACQEGSDHAMFARGLAAAARVEHSRRMDEDAALRALAALSQETRLAAVRLLAAAGREGLAAGALARRLGVPHNTLSTHLAALSTGGLVAAERSGRSVVYTAATPGVRALAAFLLVECGGGERGAVEQALAGLYAEPGGAQPTADGVGAGTGSSGAPSAQAPARPRFVRLAPDQLPRFAEALAAEGLPAGDLAAPDRSFFALLDGRGAPLGYAGFERRGEDALLRSVVVEKAWRGSGIGRDLVELTLAEAEAEGATTVWLLTGSATGFFERLGFEAVRRARAPASIQATREFAELCPEDAVLMRVRLA